jgi:ribosomal protein S18 acetylase RimI-like enzyme
MHPLDNVIWQALTTRQRELAEVFDSARRFPREVTSLAAFAEPSAEGYASLGGLIGEGNTTAVFLHDPYEPRDGWEFIGGAALLEMACENGGAAEGRMNSELELIELGAQDSRDMVELATLTKPGPFGPRTHELGYYVGIRDGGRLVAMAGERLKVPGYTEVSAVCTRPEYVGKGYARVLMLDVMQRIRRHGETPFLHVRQDNTRAVELYERLGFKTRVILHYAILRREMTNREIAG